MKNSRDCVAIECIKAMMEHDDKDIFGEYTNNDERNEAVQRIHELQWRALTASRVCEHVEEIVVLRKRIAALERQQRSRKVR